MPEDNENGEFFEGVDWRTGREKVYWQDSSGKIQRSFRKHVEWLNIRLSRKCIGTDTETNTICIVDKDGVPLEDGSNRKGSPEQALELKRDTVAMDGIKIEVAELASDDGSGNKRNGSPEGASESERDGGAAKVGIASEDGDVWVKVEQDYIKVEDLVVEVIDLT